ncbi:hypothetical protein M441DRAFT_46494 [Trichoderma asperellum CBS 433.97]|uniref:Glutamate--ammonia ligase n=1 Tax=Trichoderma asperellum (strain ATCC 204424 / CBS 433.97 / NBRC 101777) TaxID=1042311 RepID=A0A2T3Z926_TRIA4|nr:hypothetical protein M441DRAFT_46494 [Trichoderma asperellum CBS 433.97]PTB41314.1 hypothetical protein M441DRAFT_46494 [Trichoderma asperellum CBS 433.97]
MANRPRQNGAALRITACRYPYGLFFIYSPARKWIAPFDWSKSSNKKKNIMETTASRNYIAEKYVKLDQGGRMIAGYVWIDAFGETRSKSRTLREGVNTPDSLPIWNFDGSSTKQAPINNTDVPLRPCAVFPDTIRLPSSIIVLAEYWNADGTPNKFNFRHGCAKVMGTYAEHEPWFGLEQEITLIGNNRRPFWWPVGGFPAPQIRIA